MTGPLPTEIQIVVDQFLASGDDTDADEVIATAVQLLAARDRQRHWLRDELAIAAEQSRRGEAIPYTPERFAEIKRRGFTNARVGKQVKDAVTP